MAEFNKKVFKTIDEQIDILVYRGLEIKSRTNLERHLETFNYKFCINHFDSYFFNKKIKRYHKGVSDEDLIEIFYFNSKLSATLLEAILEIEKHLATCITYVVSNEFSNPLSRKYIPCMEKGYILKIKPKDFKYMMPSMPENMVHNFKTSIYGYMGRDTEMVKRYNIKEKTLKGFSEVPIWELCNYWTFGTVVDIFQYINKDLKIKILKRYFNVDYVDSMTLSHIDCILILLKNIRNRACHSNEIYNIQIIENDTMINRFIRQYNLRDQDILSDKINIYEIIEIISMMLQNKLSKNNFEQKVVSLCSRYLDKSSQSACWNRLVLSTKLFKYINKKI